jgi:hypothetical protein
VAVPTAVDELLQDLPAEPFAGTIVGDVMNYHSGRDEHVGELGEDVTEG